MEEDSFSHHRDISWDVGKGREVTACRLLLRTAGIRPRRFYLQQSHTRFASVFESGQALSRPLSGGCSARLRGLRRFFWAVRAVKGVYRCNTSVSLRRGGFMMGGYATVVGRRPLGIDSYGVGRLDASSSTFGWNFPRPYTYLHSADGLQNGGAGGSLRAFFAPSFVGVLSRRGVVFVSLAEPSHH